MWNWEKVPYRPTDSKEVRGIASKAGVHADGAETNEAGCVQVADRPVAGRNTLLGGTDSGKAAGTGV